MDQHTLSQGFPVVQECYNCGLLFANNHRCPAKDEKCFECNEYGHYSGFCLQWKLRLPKTPFSNYRENLKNNLIKSPLIKTPETLRRNMLTPISKRANKENQQEMTDKNTVSEVSDDDIQELMPKKKRFRGIAPNLNHMQQVSVNQEPMENLKERQKAAEAKNAELDNVHEKLTAAEAKNVELEKSLDSEKKLVAQYQAKLKMYRNTALNKAHDKLMEQLETEKAEVAQLTEQRDILFAYTLKIQSHIDMLITRVRDLSSEQKQILNMYYRNTLYKGYMSEDVPYLKSICLRCGSSCAHQDCIAHGNVCQLCGKHNHLTAMCKKADLVMRVTSEEDKLVSSLKETVKVSQADVKTTQKKRKKNNSSQ